MNSIRCSQCNLLNWETAEWCKRCKHILKSNSHLAEKVIQPSQNFNQTPNNLSDQTTKPETEPIFQSDKTHSKQQQKNNSIAQNQGQKPFFDAVNGFIAVKVKRIQRNAVITCIIFLMILLGAFFYNIRYLTNVALGAVQIEKFELIEGSRQAHSFRNYVTVTADNLEDINAQMIRKSRKYNTETIESKYAAIVLDDKILFAKVDPERDISETTDSLKFTGALVEVNSEESTKLLNPLYVQYPHLKGAVLPYILDAKSGFGTWAYICFSIGFIIFVFAGWSLISVLKRFGDFEKSSLKKALEVYGNPKEVAASIDAELKGKSEKFGGVTILPSWILTDGLYSLGVQSVEDIVWIYKKTTKHSVNFIPAGKTHEVILHNKQGKSVNLAGLAEKKVDEILDLVYSKIPWVIAGYNEDLSGIWNANSNEFIKQVGERKKDYLQNTKAKGVETI